MKRWLWLGAFGLSLATVSVAQDSFSKALRSEDYSAAGLTKLSPEELGRLDALVRDFKSGALAAAQKEAAAARAKALKAEEDAQKAAAKAEAAEKAVAARAASEPAPSFLERAKVMLKPGTRIEYTTLDSKLAHDFQGWERNTVFTLENGQKWRTADGTSYVTPPMPPLKVRIAPGALGSFWLEFAEIHQRVKVKLVEDSK